MKFTSPFRQPIQGLDPQVFSSLSSDGRRLACAAFDGNLRVLDVKSGQTFENLQLDRPCRALAWMSNDTNLMTAHDDGEVVSIDMTPDIDLDASELALIAPILLAKNDQLLTNMCYDNSSNLLAITFFNAIQIWTFSPDTLRNPRWTLTQTLECRVGDGSCCIASVAFFGADDKLLLIVTRSGFGRVNVWMHKDRSVTWYAKTIGANIAHCAVSPGYKLIAASTENHLLMTWPLLADGRPVMNQQRTFAVPTSRECADTMYSAPLAFFGVESIVTANRVGTIYVFSLKGQIKYSISVGMNYFIRSILTHEQMVYTVATKPEGEAMLIGYTNDLATHQTAIDSRKPADGSTFPKCQSSEPVRFDSELARLSEEEEDDVMQPVPGSSADGGGREEHEPKREVRDLGKPKVLMRLRLPSRESRAGSTHAESAQVQATRWHGPPHGIFIFRKRRNGPGPFAPGRWTFSEDATGPQGLKDRRVGDIHFSPNNSAFAEYRYWYVKSSASELSWEPCEEGQYHPTIGSYVMRPARHGTKPPLWIKEQSLLIARSREKKRAY